MTGLTPLSGAASPRTPRSLAAAVPYGAAELRLVANRALLRGFTLASALAVVSIGGGRWIAEALAAPAVSESRVPEILWNPPPVDSPRPETKPAESRPAGPRPDIAIPTPVPDHAAPPDRTIATRDDVAASTSDTALGDGSLGDGTTGEGSASLPPIEPVAPVVPAEPPADPPAPPPARVVERVEAPTVFEIVEVMPTVASRVMPEYPEMARQAGIEGRVTVRVHVGRDGRVKDAVLVRSDNAVFDDAALAAVRRWTFTPGVQAGQAVAVWMTIPIRFRQTAR